MSKLLVDEISDADNTGPVTVTDGLTVQGAFTSLGIDDNATSTAITINSSENVLVGKTDLSSNTAGTTIWKAGYLNSTVALPTANTSYVARFNRKTTDGPILDLQKDGTTVGSIGALSSRLYIGTAGTGLFFNNSSGAITPYDVNGQTQTDADVDLGVGSVRFKDLYLSGGVYLGGTGAANHLDDYEEGYHEVTLTPSNGGSITISATQRYLTYTKIGNRVFVTGKADISSVSSPLGHVKISLPFAIDNTSPAGTNDSRRTAGSIWITNSSINITQFVLYGIENESAIRIYVGDGTTNSDTTGQKLSSSHAVVFAFNYRTA
jgi:hypothetical protein